MCSVRKLAQTAAFFLCGAGGGPMEHVKLMKLMYLADREALDRFGFPISGDEHWAMRMGPVLSLTLNLMGGYADPESQAVWGEWVSDKEDFRVSLRKDGPAAEGLDQLADEEIEALRDVHAQFGDWPMRSLVGYTHTLAEWSDPGDGRRRITPRAILEALGKPEAAIAAALRDMRRVALANSSPITVPALEEEGMNALQEA